MDRLVRALIYMVIHPEDARVARSIVAAVDVFHPRNAREVASTVAGRHLSREEWAVCGPTWERAWSWIIRRPAKQSTSEYRDLI